MQCPNCEFINPDGSLFCANCGSSLEITCPKCNAKLPPSFKFCNSCGCALQKKSDELFTDLSFDQKIEKIQKYLPKGLTEKILSQRDKIEGERKQVTVMFCDMEGFTQFSEKMDPEDIYSIMDEVYEILIHKVHDYGGTVNEMTGDGVMALFGAPIALEDAPQRAIKSALAIHKEITGFNDRMRERKETPSVRMRIGIHSGPVVVGTVGNDLRVEFKVIGDTVNLASRMESIADPGSTYVTGETFKLTEGFFRFEDLGDKRIKGKEKPVRVYRVIAISSGRTRFDVSAERGLTPFIGRDRELEILIDAYKWAKGGRGQVISVISEAGVGKSRLLYEFRKAIANENVTFLEGRCLSYARSIAYQPVIEILRSNFNIRESDNDDNIRNKVQKGLKVIDAVEGTSETYILELLMVKDSGVDKIPLSPEAIKDRTIGSLRHIILKGSEIRPLIIAVEDLHWIDNNSEDVLKDLLEFIPGASILLLFTYRPEFVQTWGRKSYHSQVNLNRLSNRESLSMVSQLLGAKKINRDLENLILEKTEGIPFFIEEFIRSLRELKIFEKKNNKLILKKDINKLTIPSTIQDVIMARVDSLPDDIKDTLQVGSAIERELSFALIKEVTSLPEDKLLSNISVLKDFELLYERGVYPQSTFIFNHALTREVVYDSILTSRRKKLHEQIGDALEKLYKDNIKEHYGILSEHYILSNNYEKGAKYSKLAGKQAIKRSSFTDAISYAKKGISCLEMLPKTDELKKRIIDARTSLSNYCQGLNYHYEGMQAVAPIVDLAKKIDYKKSLPRIYLATGAYKLNVEENNEKGIEELTKAKKLSEETEDFLTLWYASYLIGFAYLLECDYKKSSKYYKISLGLSKAGGNIAGICFAKSTDASHTCPFSGKIDWAYKTCKESLDLAIQSGDIYIQQMAYACFGSCCYYMGLFEKAESTLSEAIQLHPKTGNLAYGFWAYLWMGELCFNSGKFEKSKHFYEQAKLNLVSGKIFPSWINFLNLKLFRSRLSENKDNIQMESLFEYANQNKIKLVAGGISNHICNILMNCDIQFIPEAERWINKAIESNSRVGNIWWLAEDYVLYAKLLKQKGDQLGSREKMIKAIEIYRKCGADGWVKKVEKDLSTF
jgi:class 3 adenylate cyclase/tetratricopeptide (TPR) repeat protein